VIGWSSRPLRDLLGVGVDPDGVIVAADARGIGTLGQSRHTASNVVAGGQLTGACEEGCAVKVVPLASGAMARHVSGALSVPDRALLCPGRQSTLSVVRCLWSRLGHALQVGVEDRAVGPNELETLLAVDVHVAVAELGRAGRTGHDTQGLAARHDRAGATRERTVLSTLHIVPAAHDDVGGA
jgi:hypothetical protein